MCFWCRQPYPVTPLERYTAALKHATDGKAWAQYVVAGCYISGLGVDCSVDNAVHWLTQTPMFVKTHVDVLTTSSEWGSQGEAEGIESDMSIARRKMLAMKVVVLGGYANGN